MLNKLSNEHAVESDKGANLIRKLMLPAAVWQVCVTDKIGGTKLQQAFQKYLAV